MLHIIKEMRSSSDPEEICFTFKESLYPREAIYATCYVFLDRFFILLDKKGDCVSVSMKAKTECIVSRMETRGEFMNELLSNTLRLSITKKNRKIREAIVQEALFFSQPAVFRKRFMAGVKSASRAR